MKRFMGLLIVLMIFSCTKKDGPITENEKVDETASQVSTPKEIPITSRSNEAIDAYRKGRELSEHAHRAEAIKKLEKAVELDPGFAQALALLGTMKPDASGVKMLEKAAALSKGLPESERILIELLVARKRGKMNEVRSLTRKLASLAPTDWRAQSELGSILFQEFKLPEAEEAFRKATKLNPKLAQPYNNLGYLLAYLGNYQEAVDAIERYVELKPDEPNARDSLADILLMAGKLDEAEKNFLKAAKSKDFYLAHDGLAYVKFNRGDYDGGMKELEIARKLAPRPAEKTAIRFDYPLLLVAQGKTKEGLEEITALEEEAQKNKVDWVYAWAPAKRAFIALFETRKYDEVGKHIDEALARAKSTGLSGGQLRNLRRYGYLLRVAAAAGLKRVADAEKALSELESTTQETPWDAYGVSMTNLARGCVALAKNDNQAALDHLSKCISEDLLCRWKLSEVQDILGDKQAAAKTREQIQNYRRRSATSIYIRSKVSESTR